MQLEQFTAVSSGVFALAGEVHLVHPLPGDHWLLHRRVATSGGSGKEQELVVVNAMLQPVWRLPLPAGVPGWSGGHAVSEDLSVVAVALPQEIRLLNHAGEPVAGLPYRRERGTGRAAQGEAGGCAFGSDGRYLWACVPWLREHGQQCDEVWLVDVAARQVLDRRPVGSASRWLRFHRHPDGRTVALRRASTLEEPTVWARPVDGRINLQLPRTAAVLADIHPAGHEYLAASVEEEDPSSGVASALTRYRHPDHALLERLPSAGALPQGYRWSRTSYLTQDLLLAAIWSSAGDPAGHLLVRRAPLGVLGAVRYPGGAPEPIGSCHAGRWLTVGDGTVRSWVLAECPP